MFENKGQGWMPCPPPDLEEKPRKKYKDPTDFKTDMRRHGRRRVIKFEEN